jgi:hypothetical protein
MSNPKLVPHVAINRTDETPTVLNQVTGHMLVTNSTGLSVLDLCDGDHPVPAIIGALATRHPRIDRADIARDVEEFLTAALDKGLLA